jgi:hypothetical protein
MLDRKISESDFLFMASGLAVWVIPEQRELEALKLQCDSTP